MGNTCRWIDRDEQDVPQQSPARVGEAAPRMRPVYPHRDEPANLLALIWECLRRPASVAELGMSGVPGKAMLAQLAVAFFVIGPLAGAATVAQRYGWQAVGARSVLHSFGGRVVSFVALAAAFWMLASAVSSGATFPGILSGLAFVNVMAFLGAIAVAFVTALAAAVLPESMASHAVFGGGLIYTFILAVWYIMFIMGVFDMGCVLSVFLGLVAGYLASFIEMSISQIP